MANYKLDIWFGLMSKRGRTPRKSGVQQPGPRIYFFPNLNVDRRRLPATVSADAKPVALDYERRTRSGRDRDYIGLKISAKMQQKVAQKLMLSLRGGVADSINVFDQNGQSLNRIGEGNDYALSFQGRSLIFKLEGSTLAGSPLYPASGQRQIDIILYEVTTGASPPYTEQDRISVAISTLRLPHCFDPAERMYMAQTKDNESAFRDVTVGLPKNVKLVSVPVQQSGNDSWLQDQFEIGFIEAEGQKMRLILHLPRLKTDTAQIQAEPTANLGRFILSHFPSRDIGLFDDLHKRKIPVTLVTGKVFSIKFADSLGIQTRLHSVYHAYAGWVSLADGLRLTEANAKQINKVREIELVNNITGWSARLKALPQLAKLIRKAVHEDIKQGAYADLRMNGDERKAAVSARLNEAERRTNKVLQSKQNPHGYFAFDQKSVSIPTDSKTEIRLPWDEADRLADTLDSLHDSINFGGNIEATPPDKSAKYGRILVGSGGTNSSRVLDKDLREILTVQTNQPLVEIDTTWLHVAHVDEVVACVPNRRRKDFAFLYASPGLAMQIVREAKDRYLKGLPTAHQQRLARDRDFAPRSFLSRPTKEGSHPVTNMLRGKLWLHYEGKEAPESIQPPKIYQTFAELDTQFLTPDKISPTNVRTLGRYFIPGSWTKDRLYPADISVLELDFLDDLPYRLLLKTRQSHSVALDKGVISDELRKEIEKKVESENFGKNPLGKEPKVHSLQKGQLWRISGNWAVIKIISESGRLDVHLKISVNDWIEHHHVGSVIRKVSSVFPGKLILPLPVVFDIVSDVKYWESNPESKQTGAFTPNLVNLQSIGNTLLIPRPFGPRLKTADAITLVGDLLSRYGLKSARRMLTKEYVMRREMTKQQLWFRQEPAIYLPKPGDAAGTQLFSGIDTARDIAKFFLDGFPGKSEEEVETIIYEANRNKNPRPFDYPLGRITPGWHMIDIPEDSVDLFELWTHIVADMLQLSVHWVDSWYYHVRYGEIHCGTKVLRKSK